MTPIDSGRIVRTYVQHIAAPPGAVFPLLCPVREAEWLEGWGEHLEMVHSASGVAEDGCVFRTHPPGRPETVWMVTRHDPRERIVEFVRVAQGLAATRLAISVHPRGKATSEVRIAYTVTPLGTEGRAFVREAYRDDRFREDMAWWERSMNHWLATGELLRAEGEPA